MAAKKLPAPTTPDLFGHNGPPSARRLRVPAIVPMADRSTWATVRVEGIDVRHVHTAAVEKYRGYVDRWGNGPSSTSWDQRNFTAKIYKHLGLNPQQKQARKAGLNFRDTTTIANLTAIKLAEQISAATIERGLREKQARSAIPKSVDEQLAKVTPAIDAIREQLEGLEK